MEPSDPATMYLAAALTSSNEARRFVAERVGEMGLECEVDDVALVASELVTNAVLHASSPTRVALYVHDERLRLEVHDDSSVMPERRRATDQASTGRGLALVDGLAEAWGVSLSAGGGKSVWADFRPSG